MIGSAIGMATYGLYKIFNKAKNSNDEQVDISMIRNTLQSNQIPKSDQNTIFEYLGSYVCTKTLYVPFYSAAALPNNNLILCDTKRIKILDLKKDEITYHYPGKELSYLGMLQNNKLIIRTSYSSGAEIKSLDTSTNVFEKIVNVKYSNWEDFGLILPENKLIAVNYNTFSMYNSSDKTLIKKLKHDESVNIRSIHMLTANTILTVSMFKIKIWNLNTYESFSIKLNNHLISAVEILNDNTIAIGFYTGQIMILDLDTFQSKIINAFKRPLNFLCNLRNGFLASCSGKQIKIWDISTGRLFQTIKRHTRPILAIFLLPNNKLVSASNSIINIWEFQ